MVTSRLHIEMTGYHFLITIPITEHFFDHCQTENVINLAYTGVDVSSAYVAYK